jgi:uncharacterized protein
LVALFFGLSFAVVLIGLMVFFIVGVRHSGGGGSFGGGGASGSW